MEKKAALYARVSTTQQKREATIESQVAALESFAEEHGYGVEPELVFLDQAVSGSGKEMLFFGNWSRFEKLPGEKSIECGVSTFGNVIIIPVRTTRLFP